MVYSKHTTPTRVSLARHPSLRGAFLFALRPRGCLVRRFGGSAGHGVLYRYPPNDRIVGPTSPYGGVSFCPSLVLTVTATLRLADQIYPGQRKTPATGFLTSLLHCAKLKHTTPMIASLARRPAWGVSSFGLVRAGFDLSRISLLRLFASGAAGNLSRCRARCWQRAPTPSRTGALSPRQGTPSRR